MQIVGENEREPLGCLTIPTSSNVLVGLTGYQFDSSIGWNFEALCIGTYMLELPSRFNA